MNVKQKISGFILAGGRSSRMGFEKGMVRIQKQYMIERVLAALSQVAGSMSIISNTNTYSFLKIPLYKDIIPGCGPVGGIYTALEVSQTERNLIISCDIPFVKPGLLQYIIDRSRGDDEIILPSEGGLIHPLCGIYRKSIAGNIEHLMANKVYKMMDIIGYFRYRVLPIDKSMEFYSPDLLKNINSLKDLEEVLIS
ncbi:MAG: molybdenum cofactor guanylyltransferase [Bacteroidetes bacterium]|nr:molybdenum cofactor guanylyltransferase [Bacteroidota bacterium]